MQTSRVPVLDAGQLRRQTMGDAAMQVEVLALFVAEAERLMRQVEDAPDAEVRADRLHAMIGLARNVGAARTGAGGAPRRDADRRRSSPTSSRCARRSPRRSPTSGNDR